MPLPFVHRNAPIYLAGVVVGCYAFAGIERAASRSSLGSAALIATLGLITFVLRWRDRAAMRGEQPFDGVEIVVAREEGISGDDRRDAGRRSRTRRRAASPRATSSPGRGPPTARPAAW